MNYLEASSEGQVMIHPGKWSLSNRKLSDIWLPIPV